MNEIMYNNSTMPVVSGCGPLTAFKPFYHANRTVDFHVMMYVFEGTIYVTEEEQDYEINKGELFFLKSGMQHFGKNETPRGTKWFYVHFYFNEEPVPEAYFDSNNQILPHPENVPTKYSAPLPKKLTNLSGSEIEKKIITLCEYCTSDDKCKAWYINLRFAELLSFIALSPCNANMKKLSDKIAEYLRKNVSIPFSTKALENEFFLSYKRMAVVFKAEKGLTMQQYHDKMKMDTAQQLLKSTLMPVGEIASSVGFSDQLYFSRRFREITGMSPTEFRKSAINIFL